jgi:hypothetical protein
MGGKLSMPRIQPADSVHLLLNLFYLALKYSPFASTKFLSHLSFIIACKLCTRNRFSCSSFSLLLNSWPGLQFGLALQNESITLEHG